MDWSPDAGSNCLYLRCTYLIQFPGFKLLFPQSPKLPPVIDFLDSAGALYDQQCKRLVAP